MIMEKTQISSKDHRKKYEFHERKAEKTAYEFFFFSTSFSEVNALTFLNRIPSEKYAA